MSISTATSPVFHRYTRSERLADGAVHGLGLALATAALPWMLWNGFSHPASMAARASLVLYTGGAAAMLVCSATYNWLREPRRKEFFRRLDRAVIFVMIAGTYSPLALAILAPPWGPGLMAFEWSLCALGVTLAITFPRRAERLLIVLYLLMGWAIVAVIAPLIEAVGPQMVALFLAGGLLYTTGVGIHAATKLKFHNALWHGCVIIAAGCHYAAILISVARPAETLVP